MSADADVFADQPVCPHCGMRHPFDASVCARRSINTAGGATVPVGDQTLDFDSIPIERHWGLSILLHKALGHTEPWELCGAGCDQLASEAIRELFGRNQ